MRILYIYPFGPFYPVSSGADIIATNHMEYFRKKGFQVDCILFQNSEKTKYLDQFKAQNSFCNSIHYLKFPPIAFKFGELLFATNYLANSEPLKSLLKKEYDILFSNYAFTAPISLAAKKTKLKVLETVDHLWEALAISNPGSTKNLIDEATMKLIEFELYKLFEKIIFINNEEMNNSPQTSKSSYAFIPPAWNLPVKTTSINSDSSIDMLFIGSNHRPNIDGLDLFYKNVFLPFIRPMGFKLTVAGKVCDYWPVEDPKVQKLGFYKGPIQPLYDSTKVVVIPILDGSGLSIKTLEAMAFGKAIVTTPKGARGMKLENQPFLTINLKDQPEEFSKAVIDLLHSQDKRKNLGTKALEHFKNEHSFEIYSQRMDNFLGIA